MSDTVISRPVEEPSSLLTQLAAAPAPAVIGESRRALSPSSVNQPAQLLKVVKDKQVSDTESKVSKESVEAVPVQRASGETRRSSATALKENAKEPRRRSPIVFPWTPRTRGTAVHTPSTSTDEAADAMLSSPPTVAATMTHRQLQNMPSTIDAEKTRSGAETSKDDTQALGKETVNVDKEGDKSRWSPRTPTVSISTVTTAASTPPISPRPRTQEGPERSKSFATQKVSPRTPPPVSPRTMQKKNNAAESSDDDDRNATISVSVEATSRPSVHLNGTTSDPVTAAVKTSEESTASAKAAAESSHANPKSSTKAAENNSAKPVAPLASPRQRAAPSLRSPSTSPSATTLEANTSLPSTKSVARTASPSHKDVSPDAASTAAAPLATPRGASMASRVEEIRARLAASRPSSTAVTPRSSVGSVATSHVAAALPAPGKDSTNDSNVASVAAAAASVKEMKEALKDKEKELSQLAKDKAKVEQLLEKTTKKCEDVQAKWETEKTTFAAFKKEALAQKLEAQKEIRQAQATARTAQSQQEKLQREVERQKEKLMTLTSKATSTATTPMATPRGMPLSTDMSFVVDAADAATRAKLTHLEKENESLKQELEKLKRDAAAAAKEQAAKEAESQSTAAQEAADALAKMKKEMASLAEALADRDAAVKEKEEALSKVTAELDLVKRTHAEQQQKTEKEEREHAKTARTDAETLTEASWSSAEASSTPPPSAPEAVPEPSPARSPRQVVTFELSAKEATAQLQEELTATQCQVSAYKRMHDHAERRIEQLEAELESMQGRAREAVAALQQRIRADKEKERTSFSSSDATALAAIKRELERVRKDCEAFKQRAQESGEEAVTLQSALAEAEDERDVYERQVRELQAQQSTQEWEAKAAREKDTAEATQARQALEERLENKEAELLTARQQMQEKDATLKALEENVAALQEQVKEAQAQVLAEAEAKKTAVDAYTKQVEHHKKKAKSLAKKLEESERELQLLGEEYTRVCGERDAAVLRYRTDNALPTASQPSHHEVQQQQQPLKESQKEEEAAGELSLQSDGVLTDNVSRDLSDALLSAKRGPTTHTTTTTTITTTAVSAALAQEQAARVHLEKEVSALQSKVEAMAHMASPIMDSLLSDAIESLPSMDNGDDGDFLLPQQRGISSAPPRARSPQTTHALDLRFFDPTKGAKTSNTLNVETSASRTSWQQQQQQQQHGVPSRSMSQFAAAAAASQRSPRRSQAPLSLSPRRGQHPFYTSAAASTAATGGEGGGVGWNAKGSALDALYAEVPLPPVYTNLMEKSSTLSGVSMPTLLFSTTAGSLLVSKRGRHLHRPVAAASSLPRSSTDRHGGSNHLSKTGKENEEEENVSSEACCAALTSMSHTIYASRMAAEGLFHLQHRYRFVLRVLTDCDEGDMLVGFADRYVPLESFGQKQNARRYKGCYYVNLRGGRLFAPSQNICEETYDGWRGAAETAAERRWANNGGRIRDAADRSAAATADGAVAGQPSLHSSPIRQSGISAACVARAGDEIACVLRLDEKSISFEWNGVDCGVAFTCVSLSPSLYPCVEINCSGGTVELL